MAQVFPITHVSQKAGGSWLPAGRWPGYRGYQSRKRVLCLMSCGTDSLWTLVPLCVPWTGWPQSWQQKQMSSADRRMELGSQDRPLSQGRVRSQQVAKQATPLFTSTHRTIQDTRPPHVCVLLGQVMPGEWGHGTP